MNTTIQSALTATVLAALLATTAVAQDSATGTTDAPKEETMQGSMKDGQMMGGDMKGTMQMMKNCNEMMQAMTEHMKSQNDTGSVG